MDRVRDYRPRVSWGFCSLTGKRKWCVRLYTGTTFGMPGWIFRAERQAHVIANHLNQSL